MTARLIGTAGICAVLFVALGLWVTHHSLSRLDIESVALRGSNVPLAIVFTNSGYGIALGCLGVAGIIAALALRLPVKIPIAILISQILSQGAVSVVKLGFARPRPDAWLYRHEMGNSFPSGHATTAIVFYGAWLVVAWLSPLPATARIVAVGVLAAWMAGIGWSRIALGAHYPTDVIGGYLFGIAWLCTAIALALARGAGLAARHA